jgi:hypothetical protein
MADEDTDDEDEQRDFPKTFRAAERREQKATKHGASRKAAERIEARALRRGR